MFNLEVYHIYVHLVYDKYIIIYLAHTLPLIYQLYLFNVDLKIVGTFIQLG